MIEEDDLPFLNPCPFCKSKNIELANNRYEYDDHGNEHIPPYTYYAKCWECGARGSRSNNTEQAATYWNGKCEYIIHKRKWKKSHIMKHEIVTVLMVAMVSVAINVAMMDFWGFDLDPFWIILGSILGLVCNYMFRYLKERHS